MDGDRDIDVCVVDRDIRGPATGYVTVYMNDGSGAFPESRRSEADYSPYSLAAGDLDLDGDQDIAVTHSWPEIEVSVMLNDGAGNLSLQPTQYPTVMGESRCRIGDLNGDGQYDIVTTNSNGRNCTALLNMGQGQFAQTYYEYALQPVEGPSGWARCPALANFDDDGDMDVTVTTGMGAASRVVVNLNALNYVNQSSYPKMTYPNQGRHIARAPNSLCRDVVYQSNYGVFWRWFGERIYGPTTRLDVGSYPTTAKNTDPATWVAYSHADGQALRSAIQRPDATWKYCSVGTAPALNAPSLVLSKTVGVTNSGDLGYVVYPVRDAQLNLSQVRIRAYDSLDVYYTGVLAFGDLGESEVLTPSIAITPGDFLHVVWCQGGRVYCRSTLLPVQPDAIRAGMPPVWSGPMDVSLPPPD